MTMGLPCDRDGYDLRISPCRQCGSRGCSGSCPYGEIAKANERLQSIFPKFKPSPFGFSEPDMAKRHAARQFTPVPNRLFGTTINEDGEAI